jgi:hypothetical protein
MDHQLMPASTVAEFLDAGRRAFAEGKARTDCPHSDSEDFLRYLWKEGHFDAATKADGLQSHMTTPEEAIKEYKCSEVCDG